MSNHDLKIETGRYTRPVTPREERKCDICDILEDEYHVVFVCPKYDVARRGHEQLLSNKDISAFLDCSFPNIQETALILHDIERIGKET